MRLAQRQRQGVIMEAGRNEALQLIALSTLAEAGQPVGSMRLAEAFQQAGHDLAQATAGRFLRQMDVLGLTDGEGGKRGRVITEKGLARLEELRGKMTLRQNSSRLMDAATINDLSDLHELLLVRRAVESEGARLAAERATDAELAEIVKLAQSHVRDVRARSCEFACDFRQRSFVARGEHDLRASLGRAPRSCESNAARGTGDDDNLLAQGFEMKGHDEFLLFAEVEFACASRCRTRRKAAQSTPPPSPPPWGRPRQAGVGPSRVTRWANPP